MEPKLAVHGGAWNIPDNLWPAHKAGCEAAHCAGMKVLTAGGTALEAVAAAVAVMEDDPTFDAGYGSFLNSQGGVELDAGLMEGRDLRAGAVLGVNRVKHPIDLALHVLEHSRHCIFMGEGAHAYAREAGFAEVAPEVHIHPRELEVHRRIKAGEQQILDTAWADQPGDTVGAVALDRHGNLAAGNSTGGILDKAVGRVGDAPLMGSGFYADNRHGAFVCTGWGESIMRSAMGMHGLFALAELGPEAAAKAAVDRLKTAVKGGFGGILLMTPSGKAGAAYNTGRMAWWF